MFNILLFFPLLWFAPRKPTQTTSNPKPNLSGNKRMLSAILSKMSANQTQTKGRALPLAGSGEIIPAQPSDKCQQHNPPARY